MVDLNDLTVAIPSRGRVNLVVRLLQVLEADSPDVEVLLVDDSAPAEQAALAEAVSRLPRGQLLPAEVNVSAKRNLAAQRASGSIVLFLDSDCLPQPGLATAHARFWSQAPEDAACGLGVLEFEGRQDGWLRVVRASDLLSPFGWAKSFERVPWGPTANLSVRREVFLSRGGFDESLSPPRTGGEDVEFGIRLGLEGLVTYCVPDAVATHSTETWLGAGQVLPRLWMWGRGDAGLLKRFPHKQRANPPSLLGTFTATLAFSMLLAAITPDPAWLLAAPIWLLTTLASFSIGSRLAGRGWTGAGVALVYFALDLSRAVHASSLLDRLLLTRFDFAASDAPVWREIARDQWHQAAWLLATITALASWIST